MYLPNIDPKRLGLCPSVIPAQSAQLLSTVVLCRSVVDGQAIYTHRDVVDTNVNKSQFNNQRKLGGSQIKQLREKFGKNEQCLSHTQKLNITFGMKPSCKIKICCLTDRRTRFREGKVWRTQIDSRYYEPKQRI